MKTRESVAKGGKSLDRKIVRGAEAAKDDGYMALIRLHRLKPIRSHGELDAAIVVLNGLLARSKSLTDDEQDYLECLSHEIEYYEKENVPMPAVSPADMLRHFMEARDLTASEVARGAEIAVSTLSAVLNGKRKLTIAHITRLAPFFHVKPAVFVD